MMIKDDSEVSSTVYSYVLEDLLLQKHTASENKPKAGNIPREISNNHENLLQKCKPFPLQENFNTV